MSVDDEMTLNDIVWYGPKMAKQSGKENRRAGTQNPAAIEMTVRYFNGSCSSR